MERRGETMERKILMWKQRAAEFQTSALDVKAVTGTTIKDASNARISSHVRDVTELIIITVVHDPIGTCELQCFGFYRRHA